MKDNNRYWLKSGMLSMLQNFSGVFFGFGGFYLLVRVLSKHDFGAWTLFLSTVTILEIIRNGLVQNALIKFLSAVNIEPDKTGTVGGAITAAQNAAANDRSHIISASFTISGTLSAACILLNICLAHYLAGIWKSPELVNMFYLYNVVFIFSGLIMQFNCIQQANFQFNGVFYTSVIRQGIFFVYILVCYLAKIEMTLISLIYVQIASACAGALVAYVYARPLLKFKFTMQRGWMTKLLNYGKYAFGTSVSSILSGTIDQMMLGALITPAASGAFNIAVRITNLIDIPTGAVAQIVFPQSAKRMETEGADAIRYLYEKSVGTILAILVPGLLFLYFFSDTVIHVIAGAKYNDTIPLLKVTLLYCLLIPYGRQFGTILDSIGKTKTTFFIVVFTAALNIGLNYAFISHMGVMGAAWATLCSNVVGFAIAQYILRKELGVNVLHTFIYAYRFYPEFYHKYIKRDHVAPKESLE